MKKMILFEAYVWNTGLELPSIKKNRFLLLGLNKHSNSNSQYTAIQSQNCFEQGNPFLIMFCFYVEFEYCKFNIKAFGYCTRLVSFSRFQVSHVLAPQKRIYPVNIYLFKVNNRNTREWYEIFSNLTIKHQNDVNDIILMFLLSALNIFRTFF